ncbi:MAG: LLM class flavin-dependent oxidoreductase [bacterium]
MKHGIAFTPPEPATLAEWRRLSEEAGFDFIWLTDSQSLYREVFTSLAVCAAHTRRISFGPSVINPLTRHPAVAASALATLAEMSGGRVTAGIGSGDSAVLNLGLRPARVDDVRAYLLALRGLVDELGLREYLLDRFAVAGTPGECRARIAALKKMGVQNLRVSAHVPDRPAFIRTWGEEVMG